MTGIQFAVLEVLYHGSWEPWAIFFQNISSKTGQQILQDVAWKLGVKTIRMGTTNQWGGFEKTVERMQTVFNCERN